MSSHLSEVRHMDLNVLLSFASADVQGKPLGGKILIRLLEKTINLLHSTGYRFCC